MIGKHISADVDSVVITMNWRYYYCSANQENKVSICVLLTAKNSWFLAFFSRVPAIVYTMDNCMDIIIRCHATGNMEHVKEDLYRNTLLVPQLW